MAKKFNVGIRKGINIPRVVAKVTGVIIALYVGNEIISQVGSIVNGTTGPFNNGFKLIGWTVTSNQVTATDGAGVLSVIGIVGIASIVMEFVQFNM
jgi:hypothetical protein